VLQSNLRWDGIENVFDQDAAFLTSAPRSTIRKIPPLAQDLPAWQSFAGVQERDSVTANPTEARRVEAGLRQRPITSLNHEEMEALAAPWKKLFPKVGADFPTLWP
jgi:hypothetical protein